MALWCLNVGVDVAGVSVRSVVDVADVSMRSIIGEDGVGRRDERFRQALQRNITPQLVLSPLRQSPAVVQRPADRLRLSVVPLANVR